MVNYRKPGFISKFLELQRVMWTTNAGLTDRHTFDSRPSSWPRLSRGIVSLTFILSSFSNNVCRISGSKIIDKSISLGIPLCGGQAQRLLLYMGLFEVSWFFAPNADIKISTTVSLVLHRFFSGRFSSHTIAAVVKYDQLCGFLALGWFLHYFPFYLMQRQLFLHHYFPALYFAILLFCSIFDLLTSTLRPRIRFQIATVLIVFAIWSFAHFSPLAYGSPWIKASCVSSKWVKTWDFAW